VVGVSEYAVANSCEVTGRHSSMDVLRGPVQRRHGPGLRGVPVPEYTMGEDRVTSDVFAHPLFVGLVLFLAGQLVTGLALFARTYGRLGTVEETTRRVDQTLEKVRDEVGETREAQAALAAELRAHMVAEERQASRLEVLLGRLVREDVR